MVRIPSGMRPVVQDKTFETIQTTTNGMRRHNAEWKDLVDAGFDTSASNDLILTLTFSTAKSMAVACCISDVNFALGLNSRKYSKLDHSAIISHKWISVLSSVPNAWDFARPPRGDSAQKSDKESRILQALSSENGVSIFRVQVKFQHLLMLVPFEDACSLLAFGISVNGEKHKPMYVPLSQH